MSKGFLPHLPPLPRWCIATLALIIIVAMATVPLLRHHLVTAPHHHAINTDLKQRADHYAALVDAYLDELDTRLSAIIDESSPAAALAASEAARDDERPRRRAADHPISRWERSTSQAAGANAELFLLDNDPQHFSLRGNYIAESLYEQVLEGRHPLPQAAMVNSWGIYLAKPVMVQDRIAGAVIFRTPIDPLETLLKNASDGRDHIELQQLARGGRIGRLITAGPARVEPFSVHSAPRVANWQIHVSATAPLLAAIRPPVIAFGAVQLGVWSLALLLCALVLKKADIRRPPAGQGADTDHHDDLFSEHFIREADSFLNPLPSARAEPQPVLRDAPPPTYRYPRHVFRDYDIRGRTGTEITVLFTESLGKVLGTVALERGEGLLAVGMDGRTSSPELCDALCRGILASGCDVVRLGMIPTPVLNFALTGLLQTRSGVMVTASHNPAGDNGFKVIFDNHVLSSEEILDLHERMEEETWLSGEGDPEEASVIDDYLDAVTRDTLPAHGLKLVIDCGNGVTGLLAPQLFRRLDCEVVELFCDVDGTFPNHQPDPTVATNLATLIARVREEGADLGLAFDGDGDRLVAVTASGRIVWPDELLMIFVRDILPRQPGADIVYDVKCTRRLHSLISGYGGRPVMWKTGHAHMRNKVAECHAPVGGEYSGHLFFNDRWHGFDDGLYAAARLLEIIVFREETLDDIMATFPQTTASDEIRVTVSEEEKFAFIEALRVAGDFLDGTLINIDGIRVEYPDGWGLIRASNTSPALTLRFEADDQDALDRIKACFRNQLHKLDEDLQLDF